MIKKLIILISIFLFASAFAYSADLQIRVIALQANVRLEPSTQSQILKTVPLGVILTVIKKEGNWYFVELPEEKGFKITGYIHESTVKVFEETEAKKKKEVSAQDVTKAEEIQTVIEKPESKVKEEVWGMTLSEKEKYLMKTDPYYPTWRKNLNELQQKKASAKRWFWIGLGGLAVGGAVAPVIGAVTESNTVILAGIGVGVVSSGILAYGLIKNSSANNKIEKFENEGRIKGYLSAALNPRTGTYAMTLTFTF